MRNNFPKIIFELMKKDKNIFCLLGDIGVFSFNNIFKKFKNKIINIGTLEQSLVGIAAGLSKGGFKLVIHSISPFLVLRALEQIKIDLVYNKINCNIVTVGASNDYAKLGTTHYCFEDLHILSAYKDINIYTPTNGAEFEYLFEKNYKSGINYFRIISDHQIKCIKSNKLIKTKNSNKLIIFFGYFSQNILDSFNYNFYYINKFSRNLNLNPFTKYEIIYVIEPFFGNILEKHLRKNKNFNQIKIKTISYDKTIIHKYGSKKEQDKYLKFNELNIIKSINNEK